MAHPFLFYNRWGVKLVLAPATQTRSHYSFISSFSQGEPAVLSKTAAPSTSPVRGRAAALIGNSSVLIGWRPCTTRSFSNANTPFVSFSSQGESAVLSTTAASSTSFVCSRAAAAAARFSHSSDWDQSLPVEWTFPF